MTVDQLVAVLYAIIILAGSGMAIMVGDSIRTDLAHRRAWRDHDRDTDDACALWQPWVDVCGVLGIHPDADTPIYDRLVCEELERENGLAS